MIWPRGGIGIDASSARMTFVRARRRRDGLAVSAFAALETEGLDRAALAREIASLRRRLGGPRRAVVVAPEDPAATVRLEALAEAGIRVARRLSLGEILAHLDRRRRRERLAGIAAYLVLHTDSGVVALVRDGLLLDETPLFARLTSTGPGRALLDRYTFLARLAIELRRAFERTGVAGGIAELVVCGNLPELRSFSLPLAEEFDVEVETLDSVAGLDLTALGDGREPFEESIAGFRLALEAALAPAGRSRAARPAPAVLARAAAVAAVGVAVLLGAFALHRWRSQPERGALDEPEGVVAARPVPTGATGTSAHLADAVVPVARGAIVAGRSIPAEPAPPQATSTAVARDVGPPPQDTRPPERRSGAQDVRSGTEPDRTAPPEGARRRASRRDAGGPGSPAQGGARRAIPDPAFTVSSVLVSGDRRLAVVNGRIVGVGDWVGDVRVVEIAPTEVVLRDRLGRLRSAVLRTHPRPDGADER
jgi:hypothetical protein